jgi:hypothetical protein
MDNPPRLNPTEHILQFFGYAHLPERLQAVSAPFHDLAFDLAGSQPGGPELTVALRKLLESKDAAVRHVLTTKPGPPAVDLSDDVVAEPAKT